MARYSYRDEEALVWEDNKDHIRTQARVVLRRLQRRLENEALRRAAADFDDALDRGELLQLGTSKEEVTQFVAKLASQLALEASSD